jgi:Leucine-rich repeat (LRR) protein
VTTISFENNNIHSLKQFALLKEYLPGVQRLSFKDNHIQKFDELNHLQELRHLVELNFERNPITDEQNYQWYASRERE